MGKETVVASMDSASRPSWLRESEPTVFNESVVSALGQASVPADSRTEMAFKISDQAAKVAIASAINTRLENVLQSIEEGLSTADIRGITTESTKLSSNSLRVKYRYWEKVSIVGENGIPVLKLRVFSSVEIPTEAFKAALIDAVRERQGKSSISADFMKKADKAFDKALSDDRQPTSEKE